MDKYKYSYERTPNYCYSDCDVLINKLDIHNEEILNQYERRLVAIRQTELMNNPVAGNFDFDHLKQIHKFLFQDLYHWAGHSRNCNISKRDIFCLAQHIDTYAKDIFESLRNNDYFINQTNEELIESLTNVFGDINALHAFREGNGRTQREFINMLARINGLDITFINMTAQEMIEASHQINNGNNTLMKKLFQENSSELNMEQQAEYINTYIKEKAIKTKFLDALVITDISMEFL